MKELENIKIMDKKPFFCRIGFHSWGRKLSHTDAYSNVRDWTQKCNKCPAKRKGIVTKW